MVSDIFHDALAVFFFFFEVRMIDMLQLFKDLEASSSRNSIIDIIVLTSSTWGLFRQGRIQKLGKVG